MEIEQKDPLGAVFSLIESAAKHNNETLKSQGQGERHCHGLIRHCLLYVSEKKVKQIPLLFQNEILSYFPHYQDHSFLFQECLSFK